MMLCSEPGTQATELGTRDARPARVGVFVCQCGDRISSILDTQALIEPTSQLPGVVYTGCTPYWCSPDGRQHLKAIIGDRELDRVVVAGCSPRTHKKLFQRTVAEAGGNLTLVSLVNIREGCAWPHRAQPEAAATRALDQIAMEVARISVLIPRPPIETEIVPAVLVIGGGVTGMTAALEAADAGIPVTLIERAATLGGAAATQAHELVTDLTAAVQAHSGINVRVGSHIAQVDCSVGAYRIGTTNQSPPHHTQPQVSRITHDGPFGAIIVATGHPDQETTKLAGLLRLPQDTEGFLPELRVRLRPGEYIERGIYVCGSVHYPCDAAEARFQAHSAASRALRHLRRGKVASHGPVAQVDPEKCNGCGDCFTVCPFAAVTMTEGATGLSLSHIDPLLCAGCGNCVSVCPVGAVTVTGRTDAQLEAQILTALPGTVESGNSAAHRDDGSRILVFACEWSGYAAAELAGAQKLSYPPNVRMIRLDCAGRLQPGLILKAFEMGAAGVLVLGCEPRLCHYERGNEQAAAAYEQVEAVAGLLGLAPSRLQLAWTAPDDGPTFAELVNRFVRGVEKVGFGKDEHPAQHTEYAPRSTQYEAGHRHD